MQENAAATESALTERLRFVKLDAKSAEQVRELKPIIERELPIGLDKFYDLVRVTGEGWKFFRGEDHIANARKAQIVSSDILGAPIFSNVVPKASVLRISHVYRVELSAVTAKKGL